MSFLAAFTFATLSQTVTPADEAVTPRFTYAERTTIDFPDLAVDGELTRPSGIVVLSRKPAQFPSMVELRTDFVDLIDRSVDEVK